ncbi:hypothetical protein Dip510_001380 [Elusimicrobium posterum]|uniref:ACT domain-containing protein n=1 Tax=Elusimicrobium posterum TaxID=3116653 RepID=UPI003C71B38F
MTSVSLIKQYSVFLVNQPGALKKFSDLFYSEEVNILAISQDVRYDAAVVRVAIDSDNDEINYAITKAGFTSVKTDAICINARNRVGVIREIGEVLSKEGINITTIYGSVSEGPRSRIIIVVNNIAKAMEILEKSDL